MGWDRFYVGNRLQETNPTKSILLKHPNINTKYVVRTYTIVEWLNWWKVGFEGRFLFMGGDTNPMKLPSTLVCFTGRFAPRAAYAARYACSGRKNSVKRTKKVPCLIVSANWRLENAKSPAAMLEENNPQTPHAWWVYRVCTPYKICACYLVVIAMYLVYICLSRSLWLFSYRAFVARWRIGTDTAAVGVLD